MKSFMETSVADRVFKEKKKVLLHSACLDTSAPEISSLLSRYAAFTVCLESTHMNMVGFKLLGVLLRSRIEELAVLTVEGSPHCIQLHYVAEELSRAFPETRVRHMVVSRGRVVEISASTVKLSRYLARLEESCKKQRQQDC